jgi:hypothetical protein
VRDSREKWMVVTGAPLESHWTEERSTANHSSTPARSPPSYPPLRSWRRGSIGEEVDVEAALVGLHLDETSSVSRGVGALNISVLDAAQQNAVLRRRYEEGAEASLANRRGLPKANAMDR